MTLSSDPVVRALGGGSVRGGRVLRGVAVEHALPARLHVDLSEIVRTADASPSPAEQIEAVRREGFDEGYRAGQEEARRTIEAAKAEAVRRGAEALRQAAAAMQAGRANAIAVAEQDATSLAIELTRTLVDHELSVTHDEVSSSVRRALQLTVPGEDLVVHLHPDEVVGAEMLQALVTDCRVTVVADPSVARGGCVVDTGPCRIDAQIDTALDRVRSALLSGREIDKESGDDGAHPGDEARARSRSEVLR